MAGRYILKNGRASKSLRKGLKILFLLIDISAKFLRNKVVVEKRADKIIHIV